MSPFLCCQTITPTRRMLMDIKTPVTAFQMTSLHWQRSVSVKRTRKERLNLSQPAYIGERSLPGGGWQRGLEPSLHDRPS